MDAVNQFRGNAGGSVTEKISWLDGELTTHPMVSAENRGLLVGIGVFETLKMVDGHVEMLERHLVRLQRAWGQIGPGSLDMDRIRSGVGELHSAQAHHSRLARLRITVTECNDQPSILIALVPLQPWPETTTCVVLPWRRNAYSPVVGIKTTSYADNVLGLKWAHEHGFSEGLFLNNAGELCEGATTNVFLVRGGAVLTPALSSGLLPGIVREVFLENEWAQEATVSLSDLESADEIFVTSSTRGVHPVVKCGEKEFERIGQITKNLIDAFDSLPK